MGDNIVVKPVRFVWTNREQVAGHHVQKNIPSVICNPGDQVAGCSNEDPIAAVFWLGGLERLQRELRLYKLVSYFFYIRIHSETQVVFSVRFLLSEHVGYYSSAYFSSSA